jgi:signal transduction histidine kinase
VNDPCFNTEWYQCYQEGRVSTIADVCNAPIQLCHQELLQDLQIRANLVVPILQGQSLWGLLAAHECFAPRTWQQVDVDFLMQLADQVAIAIQQSELYQQIQHLNAKLETQVQRRTAQLEKAFEFEATLKRITDKVRDSLDEDQIMQHAVQELAIALKAISCNAALYDFEQGTSTIHYEHTTLPYSAVGRVAQLADYPEIYRQIFNGIPSQFCSILPHPIRGKVAMLAYPILDDQGVLGDLWLVNHQDYRFTDEDVRLVQQVANQCAIALRQSRLYQEAQAQVKELERLNHLKDDFLSTVSHELRTPMSNIKMAIQMLEIMLKRHGLLSAEVTPAKRYFQILQNECEREINLINDLLDLSRLEAEAEVLELSEIALQTWIPRMVEPFFEKARNHQVEMRVDVAIDLPHLITDAVSLSRVLSELLSNACKYTPPLGTITLTVRQQEDLLELQVINSGVEIPVSEQNRIFEKFYRIPNSDPWKHGGTGLGLALVKKLLDCLGGTIEVDSAEGCTAFTAKIPTAFV